MSRRLEDIVRKVREQRKAANLHRRRCEKLSVSPKQIRREVRRAWIKAGGRIE